MKGAQVSTTRINNLICGDNYEWGLPEYVASRINLDDILNNPQNPLLSEAEFSEAYGFKPNPEDIALFIRTQLVEGFVENPGRLTTKVVLAAENARQRIPISLDNTTVIAASYLYRSLSGPLVARKSLLYGLMGRLDEVEAHESVLVLASVLQKATIHSTTHDREIKEWLKNRDYQRKAPWQSSALVDKFGPHYTDKDPMVIASTYLENYSLIHGSSLIDVVGGRLVTVDNTTIANSLIGEGSFISDSDRIIDALFLPGSFLLRMRFGEGDVFRINYTKKAEENRMDLESLTGVREDLDKLFYPIFDPQLEDHIVDDDVLTAMFHRMKDRDLGVYRKLSNIDLYSYVSRDADIRANVIITQKAFVSSGKELELGILSDRYYRPDGRVFMGFGTNAQESVVVLNSVVGQEKESALYDEQQARRRAGLRLKGGILAHGVQVIDSEVYGHMLFNAKAQYAIIGEGSVVLPHIVIEGRDEYNTLVIPADSLVLRSCRTAEDVERYTVNLQELIHGGEEARLEAERKMAASGITFEGNAATFVEKLYHRLHHIAEGNGAYYDPTAAGKKYKGHAQSHSDSSNMLLTPDSLFGLSSNP